MKGCELCSCPARIYCEADRASLCSDCDEKVHSANFLVAKHSRNLLCHVCQSPTPWKASGTKLGPTVSVCEICVENCSSGTQGRGGGEREEDETDDEFEGADDCSDEDEDGEFSESDDGDAEDEEGDNQVVPWSSSPPPPPPPVASSSSSEEVSSSRISSAGGGGGVSATKRKRENIDLESERDEIGCTSPRFYHNTASIATSSQALENNKADSSGFCRPLKFQRPNEEENHQSERVEDSRSVALILSSIRRLQQSTISDHNDASAVVLGVYRLSRDPTAV